LDLANDLLHDCKLANAEPSPLATHNNIAALVNCARLATAHLSGHLDDLLGELAAGAGGAA
jgi:hypothetical protein